MKQAADFSCELVRLVRELGFPEEFGEVLARELRTETAIRRMNGYLRLARPKRTEDIVDEMLSITADRDRWMQKKASESYNSRYNAYLNSRVPDTDGNERSSKDRKEDEP
jgi:hypothetical protein